MRRRREAVYAGNSWRTQVRVGKLSRPFLSERKKHCRSARLAPFIKCEIGTDSRPIGQLVDFWAPWCGPCRMVAPVVSEIAELYESTVKVVKINTDENPNVASQYGIRSIPTLMIFVGGQRVDTVVGAVPKSTLASTLEKYIPENGIA